MTLVKLVTRLHLAAPKGRLADTTLLIGRLLLSLLFLHEGLQLASHLEGAAKTMAALGISRPLLFATISLQVVAGLSIALGLLTRLGAAGLGLFCLATAFLFHTNFAIQNELLHFEKDLAIAGGMFVLVIAGAGALSFDGALTDLLRRRRMHRTALKLYRVESNRKVDDFDRTLLEGTIDLSNYRFEARPKDLGMHFKRDT